MLKRTKAKGVPKVTVLAQLCFCNVIVLSAAFLSLFSVIHSAIPHLACTRYKRCFSVDSGPATAECHPHDLRFCVREPRDSQGVWRTGQRAHHQRHKDNDTKGLVLHLHVDNYLVA